MMRSIAPRSVTARFIAAGLAALALAAAPPAEGGNKRLSQSYSYMVGDDVATRTAGFFRVVAGLEASTLVYYDRKEQNIVAYIVGSAEDVAGAKREIEGFVSAVKEYVLPYAKSQHGMALSENDVTLIYFNDGGEGAPFEVVRRENGQYKAAAEPPGDLKE
ncbi:MAG TPA: hypothetical protein VJQ53_04890 [Candidatus Eisenbacteria bacterium]|nr:hypothetical protein [Candidatus Eisenbacteria bacterium]